MASAQDTPSKKRTNWTPELNQQLFVALVNTLEPSAIDYAKIAEQLGEGHSKDTVYKRIYDIKKKGISTVEKATPKKVVNNATPTPKKRKVASDTEDY